MAVVIGLAWRAANAVTGVALAIIGLTLAVGGAGRPEPTRLATNHSLAVELALLGRAAALAVAAGSGGLNLSRAAVEVAAILAARLADAAGAAVGDGVAVAAGVGRAT